MVFYDVLWINFIQETPNFPGVSGAAVEQKWLVVGQKITGWTDGMGLLQSDEAQNVHRLLREGQGDGEQF